MPSYKDLKYWHKFVIVDKGRNVVFSGNIKAKSDDEVRSILKWLSGLFARLGLKGKFDANVTPYTWERSEGERKGKKEKKGAYGYSGIYDSDWKKLERKDVVKVFQRFR